MQRAKITERLRERRNKTIAAIARLKKPARINKTDLINAESKLGGTMFGPLPTGHRREFFNASRNVWLWHEAFADNQSFTIRYEVHPSGVYKKVEGTDKYSKLEEEELKNFHTATQTYLSLVRTHLYA